MFAEDGRKGWWIAGVAVALVTAVVLLVWGAKESWSADRCLAVAAVFIAFWGFVIAIAEIRRAASVSRATKDAISKTLTGVRAGRLGITITQLRKAVEDFEDAIIAQDPVGARRALNAWAYLASEARGPLRKRFPTRQPMLSSLSDSLELGQSTKATLSQATSGQSLWPIAEKTLEAMANVSNELAALLEELMPMIEDEK